MTRKLDSYRSKRHFSSTGEPDGSAAGEGSGDRFVVQQHDASSMHWDFRLEVDDVLASWAVPKGPSTDPRDKRLAVRTEDHPLDYADFEGVIPEGEYGAGRVIVWDAGRYENRSVDGDDESQGVAEALERGSVKVWLEGEKLRGGYALVHARIGGDDANWLLVKEQDDAADARRNPTVTEPASVLSGRTVHEVAEGDA